MQKLKKLYEEYKEAQQNFEYAEDDYVKDAIVDLYALEMMIGKELIRARKEKIKCMPLSI